MNRRREIAWRATRRVNQIGQASHERSQNIKRDGWLGGAGPRSRWRSKNLGSGRGGRGGKRSIYSQGMWGGGGAQGRTGLSRPGLTLKTSRGEGKHPVVRGREL